MFNEYPKAIYRDGVIGDDCLIVSNAAEESAAAPQYLAFDALPKETEDDAVAPSTRKRATAAKE